MAVKLEDWIQWPEVEALVYAECKRPETVLGSRMVDSSHVLITTFQQDADSVTVKLTDSNKTYKMAVYRHRMSTEFFIYCFMHSIGKLGDIHRIYQ